MKKGNHRTSTNLTPNASQHETWFATPKWSVLKLLLKNDFRRIGFCWEALAGSVEGTTNLGSSSPAKCWCGGFRGIQDSLNQRVAKWESESIDSQDYCTSTTYSHRLDSSRTPLTGSHSLHTNLETIFLWFRRGREVATLRVSQNRRVGLGFCGLDWERVWHFVGFLEGSSEGVRGDAECVSDAKLKLRPRDCVTPMPHHALCFMPASTYCDLVVVIVVIDIAPTREEWS